MSELFVIWRPWAAYVSPSFHVSNIWIWQALRDADTDCAPVDLPQLCPPNGNYAINSLGYGQLNSSGSTLVLLGTLVCYLAVFVGLVALSRRKGGTLPGPTAAAAAATTKDMDGDGEPLVGAAV